MLGEIADLFRLYQFEFSIGSNLFDKFTILFEMFGEIVQLFRYKLQITVKKFSFCFIHYAGRASYWNILEFFIIFFLEASENHKKCSASTILY